MPTDLPSQSDVFDALVDLDYPASKEAVVDHAERRGAPEAVVRVLRALPLGDYASREELGRSVDTVEATPQPNRR